MSYNQGGHSQNQGYGQPPQNQGGGAASSYYTQDQNQGQGPPPYQQNPGGHGGPPQQQQQHLPYGTGGSQGHNRPPGSDFNPGGGDGERGLAGALAGGAAGGFGGNKLGGRAGHGVLGTVAGVALGAFAGHKMQDKAEEWKDDRHDRKEEEKRREEEERRRREEDERRRQDEKHRPQHEQQQQQQRGGGGGEDYAGMFSGSAQDIRLENQNGDWMLRASCRRGDGSWNNSSISLSRYVANEGGYLRWHAGGGGGGGNHSCGPSTVTVNQGDTLRGIAARFPGTSFDAIARHNNITNPDMIYPGQVLAIPGSQGSGGGGGGGGGDGRGNFGASARDVRLADGGRKLECELERGGNWTRAWIALDERIGNRNGELYFV
ncbi:hypothetical protein RB598_007333 [Gaeumannomyces tritici]